MWVESLIPYSNYRGAIIDEHGKTWLGLDTSIKVTGYTYNAPPDILQELSLGGLRDEYLGTVQTQTPLEYIKTYVETYLNQNHPGMTHTDLMQTKILVPEIMNILPASMQYDEIAVTHEYTEIPNDLRHKARFTASDTNNNELFTIPIDTMKLSNKEIALSYEPETVEDQEIIDSYGGLDNTPAYLVRLRPILKIDKEMMVAGKDGLPMGTDYNLIVELISPNGVEQENSAQITGNLSSISIVAGKAVIPEAISQEEKDAERILYEETINYIDRWNNAEDELASLFHLTITRPIPTVTMIGGVIDVTYLLDVPHEYEWKGVFVDASLRAINITPSHSPLPQGGDTDRQKIFMQLSALQGSILENRIFEDDFGVDSVSTAKLFEVVNSQLSGVQLVTIDKSNIHSILPSLPFDDNIKDDITNAVNQNLSIHIPNVEINYQDWTGVGYIKEDISTGEAGFMLTGMIAGGMTAWGMDKWPAYYTDRLTNPFAELPNYDPQSAMYIQKIATTDIQSGTAGKVLAHELQVQVTDKSHRAVPNVYVTFTVKAGDGKLNSGAKTVLSKTDGAGIASVELTLGSRTSSNPVYVWGTSYTYLQQVGENIVDASLPSGVSIKKPFTAYGFPGDPHHFNKTFGDGAIGPIFTYKLISLIVEDENNNPISNRPVKFTVMPAQELASCDNPNQDTRQAYLIKANDPCIENSPTYGDCSAKGSSLQEITSKEGAAVGVILGGVPNAFYKINVSSANLSDDFFSLYSYQFGSCGKPADPSIMLYIALTYPVDAFGNNINAGKVGSAKPLEARLLALKEGDKKIDETLSCSYGQLTCKKIVGSRQYSIISAPAFKSASVDFGGLAGTPKGGGIYTVSYTLQPGLNAITVTGTGTISAERSYNTCDYGCLIYNPNLSASPSTELRVYGVGIDLQIPGKVFTDNDGYSMNDLKINYTITPPEYKAYTASVVLSKDGNPIVSVPMDMNWQDTNGQGSVTLLRGFQYEASSTYEAQVILNYGLGVEIRSDKKAIVLTKIKKIAIYDKNNVCNRAPDNLRLNDMLILATDASNNAFPMLHLEVESNIDIGQDILWRITGDAASPVSGNFTTVDPFTTLTTASILPYDYKLDIAVDNNGNGIIDYDDTLIRSFTVKVIPKTAYSASYGELITLATVGDLAQYRLGSSFLLTFLGKSNDAAIKPTSKNNPNTYFLETTDSSLSHAAGAWFEPITGTDYCRANIDWYIYDNNEAADVVANSVAIKDWISAALNTAAAQKKLTPGQPYTFPYLKPLIRFGESLPAKASDANLALGTAIPKNLIGTANIVTNQFGRICSQTITIQGSIEDLYDFNYFDKEEFLPLSRPASILQFGWNSGLKELVSERGEIFWNTIILNKTISFELCW